MVRNNKYSPVFFVAIPALGTVYAIHFEMVTPCSIPVFGLFLLFFSLALCLHNTYHIRPFSIAACLLFGILAGMAVSRGMMIQNRPIRTLAAKDKVSAVTCEFLSDPVPLGDDYFRVSVRPSLVHTVTGSAFSSRGTAELVFPSGYIRQSFPGFTSSTADRILPAAGLTGRFPVTMDKPIPGRLDRFRYTPVFDVVADDDLRSRMRLSLVRLLYDWQDPGGLLLALLTANRDYIDPSLSRAFRDAGLSHILALSGMHLAILGGMAFYLCFILAGKKIAISVSLILMVCFLWFAGRSPSLSRAIFMACSAALLRLLGLRVHPLPVIMMACLLQLVFFGQDILTIAFMLSYSALLGIILPGTWLVRMLEPLIPSRLISGLCASFGAQLFTVPVVIFTFGILSPYGILASCVISPLIAIYLGAGLCLVLIALIFPGAADLLVPIYGLLYRSIRQLVLFFSSFPKIVVQDLSGAVTTSILSVAAVFILYYFYHLSCTRRAPDALFARL